MKFAIIGGGITGVSVATELYKKNIDFTLFEKEASLGGNAKVYKNLDIAVYYFIKEKYKNLFDLAEEFDLPFKKKNLSIFYNNKLIIETYSNDFNKLDKILKNYKKTLYLSPITIGEFFKLFKFSDEFINNGILLIMNIFCICCKKEDLFKMPIQVLYETHSLMPHNNKEIYTWNTNSFDFYSKITEKFKDKIILNSNIISIKRSKVNKIKYIYKNTVMESDFTHLLVCCQLKNVVNIIDNPTKDELYLKRNIKYIKLNQKIIKNNKKVNNNDCFICNRNSQNYIEISIQYNDYLIKNTLGRFDTIKDIDEKIVSEYIYEIIYSDKNHLFLNLSILSKINGENNTWWVYDNIPGQSHEDCYVNGIKTVTNILNKSKKKLNLSTDVLDKIDNQLFVLYKFFNFIQKLIYYIYKFISF